MKNVKVICKKIADIIEIIFGYGILICLFVGGLTFFGYLAALIVGGDTAATICNTIYKTIYPYLVQLSTICVLIGLVKMYLCGEIALSSGKKKSVDSKKK